MSDTNQLTFSLRERTWLSTKIFDPEQYGEPGQLLRIVCDPVSSMIAVGDSQGQIHGAAAYAAPLCLTISRFRDFKYIGTRISLVPAASTGQIDPAHISTAAGVNNYMHPRDVDNLLHWRRWVGGDFRVPAVGANGSAGRYTEKDAYDLDAAWLSDSRFNHARISDGFSMFVRPLRARIETSAMATASIFGFYNADSMDLFYGQERQNTDDYQPLGQTMLTAGDVRPDSWIPNPFAGLVFNIESGSGFPGNERNLVVSGYRNRFPWFADVPDLDSTKPQFHNVTAGMLLGLIRQRLLAPICILRLPPAYGSVYYFTLYMRHYFAVRRPFLTSGTYVAARIERFDMNPVQPVQGLRLLSADAESVDEYPIIQMISPDPYGASDSADILSMQDLQNSIWQMDDSDSIPDEIDDDSDSVSAKIDTKYQGAPAPKIVDEKNEKKDDVDGKSTK